VELEGVAVDVPTGWDANVYRRPTEEHHDSLQNATTQLTAEATTHVVLHLATFSLPEGRGDYGGGAVELMGPSDALVVLFEFHPDSTATALFAQEGIPWPVRPQDFDPNQMQRPLPGQGGLQHFFQESGRAFCLYVALGSLANRAVLVPLVNQALATVDISAL
jgi:hypothetical protein